MDDQSHSAEIAESNPEGAQPASAQPVVRKPVYAPRKPATPRPRAPVEEDEDGFFKRNLAPIIISMLVVAGGGYFITHLPSGKSASAPRPAEQVIRVTLPPPPPPPPPKIQPTPPPKEDTKPDKMQAPPDKPDVKPAAPKPAAKAPEGLGTGVKGNGPGMAGLGTSGNGMIGGSGSGPAGGGSAWGWYAGQVQSRVTDALRKNPRTNFATLNLQVKIWLDAAGRVTRAQLIGSSGDRETDDAIKNEVLTGLQMQEPPPSGKPASITLRINAKRPN